MSEFLPAVVIDTREQWPLEIRAYPTITAKLDAGDYGIAGFSTMDAPRFAVERKSLQDLIGSLTAGRERFLRECERLRIFGFAGLLIEAERVQVEIGDFRSAATPRSILASLDAIMVRYGIHVLWCRDHAGAARRLEGLVRQFCRGVEKEHTALRRSAALPKREQAAAAGVASDGAEWPKTTENQGVCRQIIPAPSENSFATC